MWVSLLVLHGLSARGPSPSTAGHRSLGKPNESGLSSSSMSQAVPHKLHISGRGDENCLAFLFRNGQRSGESAVGELAAAGDQVRNGCVLWPACLFINEVSWSRSYPELLPHRGLLTCLTISLVVPSMVEEELLSCTTFLLPFCRHLGEVSGHVLVGSDPNWNLCVGLSLCEDIAVYKLLFARFAIWKDIFLTIEKSFQRFNSW